MDGFINIVKYKQSEFDINEGFDLEQLILLKRENNLQFENKGDPVTKFVYFDTSLCEYNVIFLSSDTLISFIVAIPILTVFSSFFEETTNYFEILIRLFNYCEFDSSRNRCFRSSFTYSIPCICSLCSLYFSTT